MTIHVKPEELIKIEDGTIFYRVQFQDQWSPRIFGSCTLKFKTVFEGSILEASLFKFNGEDRELICTQTDDYYFVTFPVGWEVLIDVNIKEEK